MSESDLPLSIQPPAEPGRRRLLLAGTGVLGAIGAGFAAWPFIASWRPSARAKVIGAPVEAFIGDLEPGQLLRVQWRGQTIGIMRRNERMLRDLEGLAGQLRDPDSDNPEQQPEYARNLYRSIRPEYLVVNVHCTHLGCIPEVLPEVEPQPFEENWKGGFFCPCHKSKFDLAGRVYRGVPAPTNLRIPPYRFLDDQHVIIGEVPEGVA